MRLKKNSLMFNQMVDFKSGEKTDKLSVNTISYWVKASYG